MEEDIQLKSDYISIEAKEDGNKAYKEGNFIKALILYNEALRHAESKENLAFAYANRSAVYLEFKKFDECLQNIQWARENNYPEDKIQKLNEREEKCKELKAAQVIDPEEDPWNFLKLSHPPNPKIPFIVDCLEMKVTKKYGRGIYATRDISTGDIISIEDSFYGYHIKIGLEDAKKPEDAFVCSYCQKSAMWNFIPSSVADAGWMFCSKKCRYNRENNLKDIQELVGGREKFLEFLKSVPDIKKMNYSVFDFDWSNPNDPEYGINHLKCMLSFKVPEKHQLTQLLLKKPGADKVDVHAYEMSSVFVKEPNKRLVTNFGYLINHSCIPNVACTYVEDKVIIYAIKPIKAGEQLFESYQSPNVENDSSVEFVHVHYMVMPLNQRNLHNFFNDFDCDCRACKDNLSENNCRWFNEEEFNEFALKTADAIDLFNDTKSIKPIIEQWKRNNEFITKYHKNLLSKDVYFMQYNNKELLKKIVHAATLPF